MSDLDPLLDAIDAAAGDDPAPLLAHADRLARQGDPDRAEFIRLQCEPPSPDGTPHPRVKELFDAHGPRWFAPAYELLRTTAVARPDADRAAVDAAVHGAVRVMAAAGGLAVPHAPPPDLSEAESVSVPVTADVTGWGITLRPDWNEFVRRHPGNFGPQQIARLSRMSMVQITRGVVTQVQLGEWAARRAGVLADLMAGEPVAHLALALPPISAHWHRLDGPHLRRVRHLTLTLAPRGDADDFAPIAAAAFASPHLSAVTELVLEAGWQMDITDGFAPRPKWKHARTAGVLGRLTASPLWRRLTSLRLSGGGAGWLPELSALADAPAETRLESLAVSYLDALGEYPGPLPDVVGSLARLPAGPRLKAVHLHGVTLGADAVGRLLREGDWGRVEQLTLAGAGMGDAGAKALAAVGPAALPALRTLSLSGNGIGDAGAMALTVSPLFRQLRTLDLSQNRVGDAGAEALAAGLDGGELRTLNLTVIGLLDVSTGRFGMKERWPDRILRWVTLPLRLPLMLLGRLFGSRQVRLMPLTASTSSAVRARLKERYGNRIWFGDEWAERAAR